MVRSIPFLALAVAALVLAGCTIPPPTTQPPRTLQPPTPSPTAEAPQGADQWELTAEQDYTGLVQQAAVEPDGKTAYLGTMATLYRVQDGQVQPVAQRPTPEAGLMLAPGGGVGAWLTPHADWQGLFAAELFSVEGDRLGELALEEFPFGFSNLYLGARGVLILTASPLQDWEALQGPVLYTFWDRGGALLNQVTFPEVQQVVLDGTGRAALFLGAQEAAAFDAAGGQLWQAPGAFRKAAVSEKAAIALLNPAEKEQIHRVAVIRDGTVAEMLDLPTPVHHLALTPDGRSGVVVGDGGRTFFLDTETLALAEAPRLPAAGYLFVTDVKWVSDKAVAFGLLQARGEPPKRTWPLGFVVVVDRDGAVLYERQFRIAEAIASRPAVDLTFGNPYLIVRTQETTIQVALAQ